MIHVLSASLAPILLDLLKNKSRCAKSQAGCEKEVPVKVTSSVHGFA